MINTDIYDIEKISRGKYVIYKIYERYEAAMYLVCGSEKACLIDTAYGLNDLSEICSSLTELPVTVVNTHGHIDHVLGNHWFENVYMHPADKMLYREIADGFADMINEPWVKETYGEFLKNVDPADIRFPDTNDITEGDVIDLGDKRLIVVDIPGHTQGSIMLIDPDEKICFSGDSIIEHAWLFLEESLPVETYYENLKRAADILKKYDVERIYNGHYSYKPLTMKDTGNMLAALEKICSGQAIGISFSNDAGSGTEYVFGDWRVLCPAGDGICVDLVPYESSYKQRVFEFTEKCFEKLGKKFDPSGRHTFYNDIGNEFEVFYCMTYEDKVIGTVALKKKDDNTVELKALYLEGNFRGKGLGYVLINKVIGDAKELGFKSIVLDSVSQYKEALRLYRKAGFKDIERYNDNKFADVFMRLDL